uniref:Uncharacterized protein n=1 Tax=viral metagenome TaxID=1070528 RepID=A0A6C0EAA5_9ZZZZ
MANLEEAFIPPSFRIMKDPRHFSAKEKIDKDKYYWNNVQTREYIKNPKCEDTFTDNRFQSSGVSDVMLDCLTDQIQTLTNRLDTVIKSIDVISKRLDLIESKLEKTQIKEEIKEEKGFFKKMYESLFGRNEKTPSDNTEIQEPSQIVEPKEETKVVEYRDRTENLDYTKDLDHNKQIDDVFDRYEQKVQELNLQNNDFAKFNLLCSEMAVEGLKEHLESRVGDVYGDPDVLTAEFNPELERRAQIDLNAMENKDNIIYNIHTGNIHVNLPKI